MAYKQAQSRKKNNYLKHIEKLKLTVAPAFGLILIKVVIVNILHLILLGMLNLLEGRVIRKFVD